VRVIVLHADVAAKASISAAWLMKPEAQASYHYLIERDGGITQLVDPKLRAWHAGKSEFFGLSNVNDFSIGVCFSNKQDGIEPFTSEAITMGVELLVPLMKEYGIGLECVTTHEAVARPLGRKSDPGVLFPLAQFLTALRKRLQ
jgi:N-acetyl-anhydromuramyl-L-alanine amidase AmpD